MEHRTNHPLYVTWCAMRSRCNNPNFVHYHNYGGRGITICPEWGSFDQFVEDMGPKPSKTHSLDRIDNDLGYSPSNCKWSTRTEQQRNQRWTAFIEVDGERHRLIDITEHTGCKRDTILKRVKAGMSMSDILSGVPLPRRGRFSAGLDGKHMTHCIHGHEFTSENTLITTRGKRSCKACQRARVAKHRAAKKLKG